MLATISPGAINYSQTLSTLQYAERGKNILCKAFINEDDNQVRKLQNEINQLREIIMKNGYELPRTYKSDLFSPLQIIKGKNFIKNYYF